MKVFSGDPEPPEARVRTPRARDTKVKDPFILKPTRAGGLGPISIFPQTRTAGGARGVPRRDKRRWRAPSPCASRPRRTTGGIARCFSRAPDRRRHARAPSAKEARGVGHPLPSRWISSLPTPSRRRRAREASGKDAKEVGHLHPRAGQEEGAACPRVHDMGVFDRPEPPEACTRTLGEGRVFADPKPSEASAGSLGR
ncbi:hypothetical protein K523DRAFT_358943 [Schizophyllum commune Tattone D]|nr:hypothetical protein K523DRAFT_358943 [Schizophyllum commune Tattone D]